MVARGQAAAELPGDVNPVAGLRACTGEHTWAGFADERERGDDPALILGHVAADERHSEPSTDGGEPSIKRLQPVEPHAGVECERDDGGARAPAHGRDVAEVALEKLFADGARRHGIVEVLPVNHRIDGEELRGTPGGHDGTIVANAEGRRGRRCAEPAADGRDQPLLAERADGVGGLVGKRVHRSTPESTIATECRLKSAWASIGTAMLPVRS